MLQQTRVDQAMPYYTQFMKRFPSVAKLARAPQQDVLKTWEGLGYYLRARNMHRTAQIITEKYNGRFPRTYRQLLDLPGIGPYTAAAIASMALQMPLAVLDGNVIRVLTRVFALSDDVRSTATRNTVREWMEKLLDIHCPGDFNEAVMELGAIICTPRNPRCAACPLQKVCRAFAQQRPEAFPRTPVRKKIPHKVVGAGVIVNRRGRILLAQRREKDMLGGLWEFPGGKQEPGEDITACLQRELMEELGITVEVGPQIIIVPHAFTHFTMELHAHWVKICKGRPRAIECADVTWVNPDHLRAFPLPRADIRIAETLKGLKCPLENRRIRFHGPAD
jgi:A/G-specific adenine glycosylase